MILVDKQIEAQVKCQNLICNGFKRENLHCISYDILIDSIILPDFTDEKKFVEKASYNLRSGETVYVKSDIEIQMPVDCIGRIVERNSVMRIGLVVSGPCYQPGHKTKLFLRVHNITSNDICLYKNQGIAQIMFEHLDMKPDKPYSKEADNSYQDETKYMGVQGEWRDDWLSQLEKYNQKIEQLDNMESRIYGNIITIMGVFLTMFSLLMFNFNAVANNKELEFKSIIKIDCSLLLLLYILLGVIVLIVNSRRKKSFYYVYFSLLTLLLLLNVLVFIFL